MKILKVQHDNDFLKIFQKPKHIFKIYLQIIKELLIF